MAVHSQEQLQLQQFQMATTLAATGTGCGGSANQTASLFQQTVVPLIKVFSEPASELTCNLSGCRKRAREEQPSIPPTSNTALLSQQQQQILLQKQQLLLSQIHRRTPQTTANLPAESSRFIQSAMTSTSGRRPALLASASPAEPSTVSPINNNNDDGNNVSAGISSFGLISMLHYHTLEVDALVRLHVEKLRSGLEEARKRQCRAVVTAMEQKAQRQIAEKQAELESASKRNAELEERLRQAAAESQAWFGVAKNSEALIAGLRANLEQALLQKLNSGANNRSSGSMCADGVDLPPVASEPEQEGYGDSEEEAASGAATAVSCSVRCAEASSSMVAAAARNNASVIGGGCRLRCRSCGKPDACVLLLPCRHLCLCPSCQPSVGECPICGGRTNGSLQINLS